MTTLFRRTTAFALAWGTVWALAPPVQAAEAACGLPEHIHSQTCYERTIQVLDCAFGIHTHSELCRNEDGTLICGMADYVIHQHNDFCFDSGGTLLCPLPEVTAHRHEESCFLDGGVVCSQEEQSPHVHSEQEGCYTYIEEVWTCICDKPILLQHDHDESCVTAGETELTDTLQCGLTEHTHGSDCGIATAAETAIPSDTEATAGARADDLATVSGQGIRFQLFNYSLDINKNEGGASWRDISRYFTFRSSALIPADPPSATTHVPSWNINSDYDADGFTANHATVEWLLQNGLPVLSLTRNPDPKGASREDPGLDPSTRSLAYLFSPGDHAVTAYSPGNTILQKSGNRYFYDSQQNAVDYDVDANLFRLRSYAERNSTTAGSALPDGSLYGDFLPFTYTGGQLAGENYHIASADVDYWFGMTMEVDFFQTKDGKLEGEDMIFHFSGDDDVWVFVDDVLVLDLGGTHGTATGSINFSTGEVVQYLSWNGGTEASSTTSFPTTIRDCFTAAGAVPNGGWNEAGTSLADYTEHTLKFFYLERGAAVANCKLDFRLPTLPDKSLTVSKDLIPGENAAVTDFLTDTLSYRFRVVKADENGNATEELFLQPGTPFTLLSGSGETTDVIAEDGFFTLKAGQSAQFTDMLGKGNGATRYIVQEFLPAALTGQYSGVEYEVSGDTGRVEAESGTVETFTSYSTGVLTAEQTQTVTYRNKVDTAQLGKLMITKEAAPGTEFQEGAIFQIQVKLGGSPLPMGTEYTVGDQTRAVTSEGILTLSPGETALLSNGILSGTAYEVTELGAELPPLYSGGDVCTPEGASGAVSLGSTVHITVTNFGSYRMPNTGGAGTGFFYLSGLSLTACSLLSKHKRREGRK